MCLLSLWLLFFCLSLTDLLTHSPSLLLNCWCKFSLPIHIIVFSSLINQGRSLCSDFSLLVNWVEGFGVEQSPAFFFTSIITDQCWLLMMPPGTPPIGLINGFQLIWSCSQRKRSSPAQRQSQNNVLVLRWYKWIVFDFKTCQVCCIFQRSEEASGVRQSGWIS